MKLKYIRHLCEDSGVHHIKSITPDHIRQEIGRTFGEDQEYTESLGFCLNKLENGELIVSQSQWEKIRQNLWIKTMGQGEQEESYRRELSKYRLIDPECYDPAIDIPISIEADDDMMPDDISMPELPDITALELKAPEETEEIKRGENLQILPDLSLPDPTKEYSSKDGTKEEDEEWGAVSSEEVITVKDWFTTIVLMMIPVVNLATAVILLVNKRVPRTKKNYIIAVLIVTLAIAATIGSIAVKTILPVNGV